MSEFAIRRLDPSEWRHFYKLRLKGLELFPTAFGEDAAEFAAMTPADLEERIATTTANGGGMFVAARAGEDPAGMACLSCSHGSKMQHRGHIWGVIVLPDFHGRGIARKLMEHSLAFARASGRLTQIDLTVNAENSTAHELYKKLGFREFGRDPRRLLVNGEWHDEIMMVIDLT